jgi:hypothetical protein
MRIKSVWLEPDPPVPGEKLVVKVCLHNDSTERANAMVNAMLDSHDPSFPTSVEQAYEKNIKAGDEKELTLRFGTIVKELYQPGQYRVRVWLAGQPGEAREVGFQIEKDAAFENTF